MSLEPKLAFWTLAFVNMLAILALAAAGVRRARAREIPSHRRRMLIAASLVVLFLVSYVVKLGLLGREQLELWEPRFVHVLRFHETCIAVMVLAGLRALWLGSRRGLAQPVPAGAAELRARSIRSHRRAGWTAVVSGALGAASAGYVLLGMYQRVG